jgi:hypothetical protein
MAECRFHLMSLHGGYGYFCLLQISLEVVVVLDNHREQHRHDDDCLPFEVTKAGFVLLGR